MGTPMGSPLPLQPAHQPFSFLFETLAGCQRQPKIVTNHPLYMYPQSGHTLAGGARCAAEYSTVKSSATTGSPASTEVHSSTSRASSEQGEPAGWARRVVAGMWKGCTGKPSEAVAAEEALGSGSTTATAEGAGRATAVGVLLGGRATAAVEMAEEEARLRGACPVAPQSQLNANFVTTSTPA